MITRLHKPGISLLVAIMFFSLTSVIAQNTTALEAARSYLDQHRTDLNLTAADLADYVVSDSYTDPHNQVTHIYLQQRHQGIDIAGAVMSLHMKGDQVVHLADRFQKRIDSRITSPRSRLTAVDAVKAATRELGMNMRSQPRILEQKNNAAREAVLSKESISLRDIPAKLVYQLTEDGRLQLVWNVEIYQTDAQHYWQMKIDANTGRVIEQRDLVIHCDFGHPATGGNSCTEGHTAKVQDSHKHNKKGVQLTSIEKFAQSLASTAVANAYRIYDAPIETPNHGGRTLVYTNGDPVASPYGWHYDGNISYVVTRGNNVYAYEDRSGGNAGAPAVGGVNPTQPLNFDFPIDLNQQPDTYTDAAVTNLFYWNNVIHDVFYHYGFTETSGNFQMDNLGKGGVGNDAVMAEAQDGGGTNNANFLTLPDGVPGRMQMYLWSSNEITELVHIESSSTYSAGGPSFLAIPAAFGPGVDQTGVTGDLVLVEANVNSASSCNSCGCGSGAGAGLPPNNDVSGKIVLIDRGDCTFVEKVQGAQLGGAAGVIVANNIPGAGPIAMGGDETGNTITIPAVMVSYEDGLELKDEIALGSIEVALRRLTPAAPLKDGDLDNGIIVHEYGHGISIRLTGGPTQTCLGGDEQAGEGWSDYFALMMTMNQATLADAGFSGRGIGTYVFDQDTDGNGIRPTRYARDMSVNPYTYADINNAEISVPHGVGFVFCTALWDMTWNLIDAYGYNPDLINGGISDGNVLALQLVIDGLKMQPCSPTFLESRDAILAADQALTGGANQCLIWEAFAKRGMGFSAVAGSNSRGDEVEAFDMPPSCQADITMTALAPARVNNGEEIEYTIRLRNTGNHRSKKITVTDPIPASTTYVNGSASHNGRKRGGEITFNNVRVEAGATVDLTFRVRVDTPVAGTLHFDDDMEDGISKWNAMQGLNMWAIQGDVAHSGSYAWFAADPDNYSNQILTLAQGVDIPAGAELRFRHKYNTEAEFDGGVVELSNDGGLTWYDLGNQMTRNGYSDFIPAANNPLINGFAFGGNSHDWIETVVNLNLFANQNVLIRYRLASDVLTPGVGWWVDDVIIGKDLTYIENTAYYSMPGDDGGQSSVSTLVLDGSNNRQINDNGAYTVESVEHSKSFSMITYPNPARDLINLQFDKLIEGDVQVIVSNMQGQQLLERTYMVNNGSETLSIDVSGLPAGLYIVVAYQQGSRQLARMVIE